MVGGNNILQPIRGTRNAQNEIMEFEDDDFVLDYMKDELDEEKDNELEFDKALDKI